MIKIQDIHIGTSGYSYKHWSGGVFYPPKLTPRKWLEFYGTQFSTVELNVTFYRLPREGVFQSWMTRSPDNFLFSVKASRYITHIKRLKDVKDSLDLLKKAVRPLKSKIACVLWQLPPGFKNDPARLKKFCAALARVSFYRKTRQVFEFRDESWFCQETHDILKKFNHGLCWADPSRAKEEVVTADFLYLRFHGGSGRYESRYSRDDLKIWVRKVIAAKARIKDVYVYFNNDAGGYAPANAREFQKIVFEEF